MSWWMGGAAPSPGLSRQTSTARLAASCSILPDRLSANASLSTDLRDTACRVEGSTSPGAALNRLPRKADAGSFLLRADRAAGAALPTGVRLNGAGPREL